MRRFSRFLLAFGISSLLAPAAHARPAGDIASVALHPWTMNGPAEVEQTFAGIAAMGVGQARVDLRWNLVEPDGPALASGQEDWSQMDAIVAAADRHGVALLPILAHVPEWASPSGEPWAYPDAAAFETFFGAALRRYPQIPAWEVWNEPNYFVFAHPRPDPAGFVELLKAARRTRDRIGSRAKLVAGGLAPGAQIDIVPWIDEVARLGGLGLVDGLGIHPYSPREPDDPRAWMTRLESLHEHLDELGHPDLPLWLTEYGAPAYPVANWAAPPLSEQEQAQRLRVAFALAQRLSYVENLTWFEYRDSCAEDVADCRFGLVREDMSPRPAWNALRGVVNGASAKLRSRLAARLRMSRRARVTIEGSLALPGTPRPQGRLRVHLLRRGRGALSIPVTVRGGAFRARLRPGGARRGIVEVRYAGTRAYAPAVVRVRVGRRAGRALFKSRAGR